MIGSFPDGVWPCCPNIVVPQAFEALLYLGRIWAVSLPFRATDPDQATASTPGRLRTQHHPDNALTDDLSNAALDQQTRSINQPPTSIF